MAKFCIRPITDPDEFSATAYDVYKVFYERTNYWYKNDRIIKDNFVTWAKILYLYPKINKTGIYIGNKLSAVETSFRIEDIIIGDYLFSDDASLSLNVIDFIMHKLREAAACTDAKFFCSGLPTGVSSLDDSKLMRGCKLLSLPAYCKINPFALALAKFIMKDSYRKLQTVVTRDNSDSP